MKSKLFRNKHTGRIATQIPILDINEWEEVDELETPVISVGQDILYRSVFGTGPVVRARVEEMVVTTDPRAKPFIKGDVEVEHVAIDHVIENRVFFTVRNYVIDEEYGVVKDELSDSLNWCYSDQLVIRAKPRAVA